LRVKPPSSTFYLHSDADNGQSAGAIRRAAAGKAVIPGNVGCAGAKERNRIKVAVGNIIGTSGKDLLSAVMNQLVFTACSNLAVATETLNTKLSLVMALEPRNPAELLFTAQMVVIHCATMSAAQQLSSAIVLPECDLIITSNMLIKLARTYAIA
jgi:hypothetical protein